MWKTVEVSIWSALYHLDNFIVHLPNLLWVFFWHNSYLLVLDNHRFGQQKLVCLEFELSQGLWFDLPQ